MGFKHVPLFLHQKNETHQHKTHDFCPFYFSLFRRTTFIKRRNSHTTQPTHRRSVKYMHKQTSLTPPPPQPTTTMMNQQPHHSPTVATSTLKRSRTSILRSDEHEPVFQVEGSYWPRVLLSDSIDPLTIKRRGSGCDRIRQGPPSVAKASKRGVKNMNTTTQRNSIKKLRRIHKALVRHMMKTSSIKNRSNDTNGLLMPPLLPSLVSLPQDHCELEWTPSPMSGKKMNTLCSSLTGKAWPIAPIPSSRDKVLIVQQQQQQLQEKQQPHGRQAAMKNKSLQQRVRPQPVVNDTRDSL